MVLENDLFLFLLHAFHTFLKLLQTHQAGCLTGGGGRPTASRTGGSTVPVRWQGMLVGRCDLQLEQRIFLPLLLLPF